MNGVVAIRVEGWSIDGHGVPCTLRVIRDRSTTRSCLKSFQERCCADFYHDNWKADEL